MFLFASVMALSCYNSQAQDIPTTGEKYGRTLNLGFGVGYYYGYYGHTMGAFNANYEIDVARNFTLAPFIGYHVYNHTHYWGSPNQPHHHYRHSGSLVLGGVKGAYYFDGILNAGSKWDFYMAGSVGFAYRHETWEEGYEGDIYNVYPIYLDVHAGAEYHLTNRLGLYLDLSSAVSTFGFAFHL
jgi:hypothetical protein